MNSSSEVNGTNIEPFFGRFENFANFIYITITLLYEVIILSINTEKRCSNSFVKRFYHRIKIMFPFFSEVPHPFFALIKYTKLDVSCN